MVGSARRICGVSTIVNRNATKPDLNRFNWVVVSFCVCDSASCAALSYV